MISTVHPAFILIFGALLSPLFKGKWKSMYVIALPLLSMYNMFQITEGQHFQVHFLGFDLMPCYVDKMSRVFGIIFHIITVIGMLFALQVKDRVQNFAGLAYAGATMGVVFAGDMLTLFLFWETLTVTAAMIIWCGRSKGAQRAGFRYMFMHALGGLMLLAGILMRASETGSLAFGYIGLDAGLSSYLIFLGFGVNAAWPGLHTWLVDAYPEASPTGTVFLSAYTTKSAVYVLARAFPGAEPLIWIGLVMTVFPIFFAVLENNLRRVLSYSLINQVGYMMVGVGIGTELSLNGTCSHAFAHILYKALLFMSMGAVLTQTGKIKATELGGLYKYMPFTAICCMVGSASISGFPLFSGFISKSMVMDAAAGLNILILWFGLLFASAGVLDHSGIKIPFFAFFSHDSGLRPKEAPWNMRLAMGVTAVLCFAIGVYPQPLYNLLPYEVNYVPYTWAHVITMFQLLCFAAFAFVLLLRSGIYPAEIRSVNLDMDFFYRKGFGAFYWCMDKCMNGLNALADRYIANDLTARVNGFFVNAPQRLAFMAMIPVYILGGNTPDKVEAKRKQLYESLSANTSPVGATAAAATIFVFVLIIYILAK